ncbi:MAG: hypothetical protein RL497_2025 [Pseudomonadota bacterium]
MVASFACVLPALGFTGKIALTFDDAPTPDSALLTGYERTQKIIAALQTHKVPDALFFVKAENLNEETLNRLKHYTNAGLHLANHSFSHQSAHELSTHEFLTDAYRAHLLLKDLDNFLPYFRPPYLHYGKDLNAVAYIQKNLAQLNYQDGFVTIDNADWYINSLLVKAAQEGKKINLKKARALYVQVIWEAIVFFDTLAQKTCGKSPNHVLLLHENDTTALFLSDLIRHIRKNGGEIISPQQAYADPIYKQFPANAFQKQGRIAAMAQLQGVPIEQLKHPAEDSRYLDALFKKHAVIK